MQHLDDGLLHALVDGEVPSSELGPIQAHLDICADCRTRLDDARAMAGESNALIELIEVPAASSAPASQPSPRRMFPAFIKPLALAASLGLAVAIGYAGGVRQGETFAPAVMRVDTLVLGDSDVAGQDAARTKDAPASGAPPATASELQSSASARPQTKGSAVARDEVDQAAQAPTAPAPAEPVRQRSAANQELREESTTREGERAAQPASPRRNDFRVGRSTDSMLKRALNEGEAKSLAAPQARAEGLMAAKDLALESISFPDAVALLGGRLKLIEGLVPARLESAGGVVRVVYPLERGELILEQRRVADSVAVALIAPTLSPDSLETLRHRVR